MRTVGFGLLFFTVAACDGGGGILDVGTDVYNAFPFDGDQRTWDFINVDKTSPYFLTATTIGEPEVRDGTNVYAVSYRTRCRQLDSSECIDGEELRNIRWSSDASDGVFIHAYTFEESLVRLDPPLQVAFDVMRPGTSITTQTAGIEWISTYEGQESCPSTNQLANASCAKFTIEAPNAANEGEGVAGTYWAVPGRNVVAIDWLGDIGLWEHRDDDCFGECDGRW